MNQQTVVPTKTGKSNLSKIIAWLHLWPSLVSAIILIFVCITGTIIVYCDEIIDFSNREVLYVKQPSTQKLPTEQLLLNFKKTFPERRAPGYMVTYRDPNRTVKFNSYDRKKGLRLVYMDPYTGEVVKDDGTIHFFFITAHLHSSLLWSGPGEWIIDIATLIFLLELITGLVLWWPIKWTKATKDASFKIRWNARFKRLNYDLHNVLGFYALLIALALTVTGLIIAFHPWAEFTIKTFGGDPSHDWEETMPAFTPNQHPASINVSIENLFKKHPTKSEAQISTSNLDSSGFYRIAVANKIGLKSADSPEYAFINRYTGKEITETAGGVLHEKIENVYWTFHMGTWLGPIGKLVTFLGGIICTSLPVTGFLIWWGRRKKGTNPKKRGKTFTTKTTKRSIQPGA